MFSRRAVIGGLAINIAQSTTKLLEDFKIGSCCQLELLDLHKMQILCFSEYVQRCQVSPFTF
jgi:hypothetical protein